MKDYHESNEKDILYSRLIWNIIPRGRTAGLTLVEEPYMGDKFRNVYVNIPFSLLAIQQGRLGKLVSLAIVSLVNII